MLFVLEVRSRATEYRDHLTPVGMNAEQLPAPPPHFPPPADEATPLVLGRPEDPYFRDVLLLLGVTSSYSWGLKEALPPRKGSWIRRSCLSHLLPRGGLGVAES